MTCSNLRNIHTRNSYWDALPCVNMALKLPWYFYLLMENPVGCYSKFDTLTIRWHSAIRKHLFLYPQGDSSGLKKPKKEFHSILKEEFHTNYKNYRNLVSALMKKSKQAYYDSNWSNIKNTWKGIKSLISLKTITSSVPTVLSLDNSDAITNSYEFANIFNNYFASIAETTKKA